MTPDLSTEHGSGRHAVQVVLGTVTTTVVSVMPVFLLAGLAVQVSDELGLTPADLGVAVAGYFGLTALASVPVGRLVERYGARRAAQLAVLLSAAGMLAIALFARSALTLFVLLAGAAAANALGQLASNAALAHTVPARRQGLMFGVKQSAIPLSTLLAGAAVPVVALTIGWRWAFGIGAALAVCALTLVPPDERRHDAAEPGRGGRPDAAQLRPNAALILLGVGAMLAAGGANGLNTFLVDSTVARGIDPGLAGLMLTLGSVICIAMRVAVGWLADRWTRGHLAAVAGFYALSAIGLLLLSLDPPAALVAGVVLGFGIGWSWPGLQNFAVVRLHPQAPAAATSVTQTGVYAGAALGPLALGWVVTEAGYRVAWTVAGASMALACALVLLGARAGLRLSRYGRR